MKNNELSTALKNHYRRARPDALEEWVRRLEGAPVAPARPLRGGAAWRGVAVALLAGLLAFSASRPADGKTMAVLNEVANAYGREFPAEFGCTSYDEVCGQLQKLPFAVAAPGDPRCGSLNPVGARYCSLQGEAAALIQLLGPDDLRCTLYQAQGTSNALRTIATGTFRIRGLIVRIWREGDILFALASPKPGC
jgi:hypothetical protein